MSRPGDDEAGRSGRTCSLCGAVAPADDGHAALNWSTSVEAGRRRSVCPDCTRANVRSIEGRLSEEWW